MSSCTSFFFFLLLCFTIPSSSSSSSSYVSSLPKLTLKKQASILLSLKKGFENPQNSSLLQTWDASNYLSLCSWEGIKCDNNNHSINMSSLVVSLDISNSNLSGSLSPAIAELSGLVDISVAGNGLSGEFPLEILRRLPRLRSLNISNNMFTGNLSIWEESSQLEVLDAYDNNFNGSLPFVTYLPSLKHLNFGGNYFSGKIPESYGKMVGLEFLFLAGNDLNGFIPKELGNLTNLTHLYLGYFNKFDGGIPSEIGSLVNLVHLDLANCGLKGTIPSELGKLENLDTLFLQTNQLSGPIPPELGNLRKLRTLDLSNNEFKGEIPNEFSNLLELTLIHLFINKLHGEIPHFISELPKLETLNLWQNNFTGSIPPKLGQNGKLKQLDLSSNKLTGLIPKSLCLGRSLKILILLNNFLFGSLPEDLGKCFTLERVRLGQNYLTGKIPNGFLYLPQISLLELQNNYLTGFLPHQDSSSASSSKLGQLNLSNNRLSGNLPGSIGNFPNLQTLLLSGNKFSGQIPPEIGRLKNLLKLDLSRNNISGSVPPQIGHCVLLTYLDLSQNQLSGPIPLEISQIHILNYLNLSRNNLNQTIPKEIATMKGLTSADFSHNNFSGSIPEVGLFLVLNSTFFQGNPNLCGYYSNNNNNDSISNPCEKTHSSTSISNGRNASKSNGVPGKYKLGFAIALLGCSLVFAALAIIKSKKKARRKNSHHHSWKITAFQKLEYGSEEILGCIKESNVIGRGGAGIVYRGTMANGEELAVKKLLGITTNKSTSSHHHHHDNGLSAEIRTVGRIRHRYIVRLLAFVSNRETNLLVYEYMPNGSLGEVLHGRRGESLKWETRLKIAIEAAKGLCYLHHDCSPLIIHRDVKSNNILLNSEFEAHVADFGLAKFLHDTGASECMSSIAGSYGYIAPEYAYTLKVDEKSDVYSFGVVLLELITGRRPVGDFGEEGLDIVQWTKIQTNWSKEKVVKILDERIHNNIPLDEAKQVFFVAMLCVQEHSVERPTMREVVEMLSQAKQPNTFQMQ